MVELGLQVGFLVTLAIYAAAWRWGGPAEFGGAALVAMSWSARLLNGPLTGEAAPVVPLAIEDVALFVLLLALTWRSRRAWTILAVAVQAVALGVHVIRLLTPGMSSGAYLTALVVDAYAILAALGWGIWVARRQKVDIPRMGV